MNDELRPCPYCDDKKPECNGVMGVPVTFIDKYNRREYLLEAMRPCKNAQNEDDVEVFFSEYLPNFEILGCSEKAACPEEIHKRGTIYSGVVNGKERFKRIFIRNAVYKASQMLDTLLKDFWLTAQDDIFFRISRVPDEAAEVAIEKIA